MRYACQDACGTRFAAPSVERFTQWWIASYSGQFDLKRDPGGIVDIEFVVRFLVLAARTATNSQSGLMSFGCWRPSKVRGGFRNGMRRHWPARI